MATEAVILPRTITGCEKTEVDPETSIFFNPLLVQLKREKNFRDSLVRSLLIFAIEPCTFKYTRKRCHSPVHS